MRKLYFNGTIITMDAPKTAEAVLTENGKIAAVGSLADLQRQAMGAQPIDLGGKVLLPAFLDAHSHFSAYANSLLQVPLEECATFEEIETRIRSFMTEHKIKPGEWVLAKGYDHNSLVERQHPTLLLLDACCPVNPLVLQHASGHVGVFNSQALQRLGVTPRTLAPEGGVIGKNRGALTGYMEENAYFAYMKMTPMPDAGALMAAYATAQKKYASYGITTIQEGMTVRQMIPLYTALLPSHALMLDVVGYADYKDAKEVFSAFPGSNGRYDNRFKLGGYKIFLDGSPQGRTAWMRTPYQNGEPGYCGYGTMKDEEALAALQQAVEENRQILAHCNGDAAAQQLIDCAKKVSGIEKIRPVMIHAQLLGRDQLHEVRALGMIPSFFVAHVAHWGDVHCQNFGEQRAAQISPAHSALEKGIRFTFHQDSPVIEPDMLETVWCAVERRTKSGRILGAGERITAEEALRAVTINAAYQYFEEDTKGSISPRKKADFVLLDRDPLQVPTEEIREIKVLATIKNDTVIYRG